MSFLCVVVVLNVSEGLSAPLFFFQGGAYQDTAFDVCREMEPDQFMQGLKSYMKKVGLKSISVGYVLAFSNRK